MALSQRKLTTVLKRALPVASGLGASLGLCLAAAGCHGRGSRKDYGETPPMGPRPVAMRGEQAFFGGDIEATVLISRGGNGGGAGRRHGGESEPDVSDMSQDDAMAYLRARAELGSPMPPVAIRLRLENHSKRILQVDVVDFDSYLGDFAVQPELLSLAPEQTAEPDPMISQLGVTSDVIPVKVALSVGGKVEEHTIPVKNLVDSGDAQ